MRCLLQDGLQLAVLQEIIAILGTLPIRGPNSHFCAHVYLLTFYFVSCAKTGTPHAQLTFAQDNAKLDMLFQRPNKVQSDSPTDSQL